LVIGAVTLGAASPDGWGSWCYGPPSRWFSRGSRTGCSMPRPIGIYGCKPGRAAAETCPRRWPPVILGCLRCPHQRQPVGLRPGRRAPRRWEGRHIWL